ncbi:MAG: PTS sugar transporter subunit IIA [Desulfurococcaceae archaeon]
MSYELNILELIDDMILVNANANDWKEAVRLAGELLVKNSRAKESYIEAMIRVTEELGPYAVIAPGIAIPHARPEDGALRPGFSIVVLRKPVNFGSHNDPVYIVIGFTAVDKTSHLRALQILATLISDEEFKNKVINAKSEEEVKKIMREYLEKLLHNSSI